jgi:micrococcal nuclease
MSAAPRNTCRAVACSLRTSSKTILRCQSLLLLFLLTTPALSYAWTGKVVGVSDGDTITVMHDEKGEKVRFYGVDCPESHQDFGTKTKEFTSAMVFGRTVEVEPVTTDRYGRTVALVMVDGKSLNEELVKAGMAWVYVKYCKKPFCAQWYQLEETARSAKMGLWSIPNPTPPWEFRHPSRKKERNSAQTEDLRPSRRPAREQDNVVSYYSCHVWNHFNPFLRHILRRMPT